VDNRPADPSPSRPLFLPTTREEMRERGFDALDVLLVVGDAYVDHPSFGTAVIGRVLEAQGLPSLRACSRRSSQRSSS
jgi:hypothetical protein